MSEREQTFRRIVAVWQGEASVDELDDLVTSNYIGHLGSRSRDLAQLKADIAAYRQAAPGVEFRVEQQFGDRGDHLATRWTAEVPGDGQGSSRKAVGLNISRWSGPLLAEEWAVWEQLSPPPSS